jgi:hypothetical protein
MNLKNAKAAVALAKKLQCLLKTPEVSFFFEAHPEHNWDDFQAWDAWSAWVPGMLSDAEKKLYQESYEEECLSMEELISMLNVESNRVPSEWNADGY